MSTSFAALKKNRSQSLEKLSEQLKQITTKGYSDPDEGAYWKPERDAAGNGFAIIRFLPAPEGEEMPFVKIWDHGFQGPGGWYIENSLTTLSLPDPVSEMNSLLWNASTDDNSPERKQARTQKRRLHYVANIYVVKDSAKPDNEGKVFKFKFGKKIFDKLNESANPSFEDEDSVNPFDLWEGANFRLKIRQVDGYANYDKSEFDKPGALLDSDDEMEGVWKQCASLSEIIAQKNFKSYDELKAKLQKVLGLTSNQTKSSAPKRVNEEDENLDMSALSKKSADQPKVKEAAATQSASTDEDDEDLEYFKNLSK